MSFSSASTTASLLSTSATAAATSSSSSSLPWLPAVLCFAAGAATATTICYHYIIWPEQQKHEAWKALYSVVDDISSTFEDISARIGELPRKHRKQIPWPWDRMHKHKSKSTEENNDEGDNENETNETSESKEDQSKDDMEQGKETTTSTPSSLAEEKTPDLCIGSIFGLDVGGTLAKLVYFEERPVYRNVTVGGLHSSRLLHRSTANFLRMEQQQQQQQASSSLSQPHMQRSFSTTVSTANTTTMANPPPRKTQSARDIVVSAASDETNTANATSPQTPSHYRSNRHRTATDSVLSENHGNDHSYGGTNDRPRTDTEPTTAIPPEVRQTKSHNDSSYLAPPPPNMPLQQPFAVSDMRRTQSMMDFLTQREHRAQALDRFYAFARDNLNNNPSFETTEAQSSSPALTEDVQTNGESSSSSPTQQQQHGHHPQHHHNNDMVRDQELSFDCLDGTFHFLHFETRKMHQAVELIRRYELHQTIHNLGATGGGAHKFAQMFGSELGISMTKLDELECLVAGMQFVLQTVVGECYTYRPPNESSGDDENQPQRKRPSSSLNNHYGNYVGVEEENWTSLEEEEEHDDNDMDGTNDDEGDEEDVRPAAPAPASASGPAAPRPGNRLDEWWWSRKVPRDAISDASTYPYLLVTIGTGVSILRVDGPRKHERISGSTIGGGTYWGLIRLLTSVDNFSDVIMLAEKGDPSKVDMMVGDIYGSKSDALEKLGLREDLVASSFGKLVAKENPAEGLKEEDLARALLLMVTNNIGQVAYLNARLHETSRIYFVGNFLRQNRLSQRRLSFAIDYWSKGKMEALFLEHEGYFGALGAFLLSQGISSHFHHHAQNTSSDHHTNLTPQHSMPTVSSGSGNGEVTALENCSACN